MATSEPDVTCYVYEWRAWSGYLLSAIIPNATRIPATLIESYCDVMARINFATADLFALHVNLTDTSSTPVGRQRLFDEIKARHIVALNASVTSIAKRTIQAACRRSGLAVALIGEAGDPGEVVIVKSNLNYGGEHERQLGPDARMLLGITIDDEATPLEAANYFTTTRSQVPERMWKSNDVVIERFVTNRHHTFYRAYTMMSHVVVSKVHDEATLKKMPTGISRQNWFYDATTSQAIAGPADAPSHVYDSVRRLRGELGLDFGALDIVEDDQGIPYIVDVNVTPYWGERHDDMVEFLREGLFDALGRRECP
jgi:hypothetical protein